MSAAVDLSPAAPRRWSPAEDALIGEHYPASGLAALRALLPDRSDAAIHHRANRRGVARVRRWTRGDDARLRFLWGDGEEIAAIAADLGRTEVACYWRAGVLGLPRGVPQGFEPLTAAARRAGYAVGQLRRILPRGAARPRPVPDRGGRAHRMHVVEPSLVDAAVAAHLARECVNAAARARGLLGETLGQWLRAAGLAPPGGKRRWYVATDVIDRVVALHRSTETIAAGARRHAIDRATLGRWLRDAGAIGAKHPGRNHALAPAAIDAVVARRRAAAGTAE